MQRAIFDKVIDEALFQFDGFSDLLLATGRPCQVSVDRILQRVVFTDAARFRLADTLEARHTQAIVDMMIGGKPDLAETLSREGSCDLSYVSLEGVRFRVNIFAQRGGLSLIMRRMQEKIPTLEQLDSPECFTTIAKEKSGIVFFTGGTGTGKTTSLNAVLDYINKNESVHILTLEDPVEYVHPHRKATFSQRELGADFSAFSLGLRAALRQAPDVILVGEIRDADTMNIALSAAETGHLVLSTLHTSNAGKSINRIVGMFPVEDERRTRARLADSVKWIVSQRLLHKTIGGRVAIYDILKNTIRTKELILNGESENKLFSSIQNSGRHEGMRTFDSDIIDCYRKQLISVETALAWCDSPVAVRQALNRLHQSQGKPAEDHIELTLEKSRLNKRKRSRI